MRKLWTIIALVALAAVAVHHLIAKQILPERFPDGVIFHSFYGQPDVNLALEHIATSFGVEPKPSPAIAAQHVLSRRTTSLNCSRK